MKRMLWLIAGLLCGLGGVNGGCAADGLPWTASQAQEVSAVSNEEEAGAPRHHLDAGQAPPLGLGQLVIQDVQSGSPLRLNIARYHLHVVLQPPVALVQIDQSFYNPFPRQQEGTFVFNLPHGASVSRFAMYVTPSELIEGELIERQRAARIYQSIVDRQRDPAILEQIGDNLFKMRVFPIFAKDEKRILLDFTLPLESFDNVYDFRLPLLSDLAPIWDFRITGSVRGTGVSCLSHPAMHIAARDDGTVTLDFGQQNYRPETDLVLSFEGAPPASTMVADSVELQSADDGPQQRPPAMIPSLRSYRTDARRLGGRRGSGELFEPAATYFMVRVPPPTERRKPLPADVLLLADTSSGVEDLARVRGEIRRILAHLGSHDRFRLFAADVTLRPMHDGWLSPGDEQVATVLERFEQEFCLGGTDMGVCLHEAAEAFDQDGENRRMMIYVGDGADPLFEGSNKPTGQHFWQQWQRRVGADFTGILVQQSPDGAAAVSASARAIQGLWFDLAGDVGAQRQLLQWLRDGLPSPQPVLQVEVAGADAAELFWPGAWPPGRTLTIYGRTLQPGPIQLALTLGCGADKMKHTWTLSAGDDADDVFVGRLWAQRRLDQLRRMGTEEETQRAAIIALSQEWSLLSPLTAFLVLETEADYKRWQIDRQVRRRYWKPAEARSDEPLPAQWLAEVTPPDPPSAPRQRQPRSGDPAPEAPTSPVGRLPFDPLSAEGWELRPSFAALVGSAFRGSPDFLRRHPHAQTLLQPTNLMQLGDGCTLDQFAHRLSEITGVPVMLDKRALDFLGIEEQTPIGRSRPRPRTSPSDPWPVDSRWLQAATISLRSGVRHLLEPLELVMIEEPHRLLITSVDAVVELLVTEFYPVDDLVYTDRLPTLWSLSDPYLDRDERSRRRLDAKLQQPVTADLENIPLQQAVDRLASLLGETIVLDHRWLLADQGITPDRQITTTWRDIPAREALRWMLDPLRLDWEFVTRPS
jgi:Ca-activated chloride channel homolog